MTLRAWTDTFALERAVMKEQLKARMLGQEIAGTPLGCFRLLRLLGRGTTGSVYEARDTRTDALVAVKWLQTRAAPDVQRFKREFRGLSHVVHDNLVQLYELFADGDQWYFSMELVSGVGFVDYVRNERTTEARIRRLRSAFVQLLSAVRAIHVAGRLHCDLKPSNVMVDDAGRVVVLDFGLLRPNASSPLPFDASPRSVRGTPAYMAPELDDAPAPTRASDVYSLGMMLFQSLTGAWPFNGSPEAVVAQRRTQAAPNARSLTAGVPEDLAAICGAMLERESARRPSIDVVLEALREEVQLPRVSAPIDARGPFIGREAELQTLHVAFEAVRDECPVAVFIHGPSGMGKSGLAQHFSEQLAEPTTVLRGRCHERESLPYKAFDGLVDALRQHLRSAPANAQPQLTPVEAAALFRMFPQLELCSLAARSEAATSLPQDVQQLRERAFQALKRLLRQVARQSTLVCVVDDLQWADRDSARLLVELLSPPDAPGLLYVGCYRNEERLASEFLVELSGVAQWPCDRRSLALAPLDREAATALARQLLKDPADAASELAANVIAREAQGVPLFIRELAAHSLTGLHSEHTAFSFSELLSRRVSGLSDAERRILSLISLASRPVPPGLLGTMPEDATALQRTLSVLRIQGLVHSDAQGRLVVYHDQLRELLTQRMSADDASRFHRTLAEAYERSDATDPEWLIEHWRGAGERERALRYARLAAQLAASKLAFNRAAALYHTALDLEHDVAARRELYAELAESLVNARRDAAAARAFLAAVDASDAASALALRSRAAQQFLRAGHKEEAWSLLKPLFAQVGIRYPNSIPEIVLHLWSSRIKQAWWLRRRAPAGRAAKRVSERLVVLGAVFRESTITDPLRVALFQSQFYENAIRANDRMAMFMGYGWDTYNRAIRSGWRKRHVTLQRLEQVDAMADQLQAPYAWGVAQLIRGATSLMIGDWHAAAEHSARGRGIFRDQCLGALWEHTLCELVNCGATENVGPIRELAPGASYVMGDLDERVDQLTDALVSVIIAHALLAKGKALEARAAMDERLARLAGEMDMQLFGVVLRSTDIALYARDGERAWSTIQHYWDDYIASGYDHSETLSCMYRMRVTRAALMLQLQRRDTRLEPIIAAQATRLRRMGRPDALALVTGIEATLAFQAGDLERTRRLLRRASVQSDRAGLILYAQALRLQLGRISPQAEREQLVSAALTELREHGVSDPDRWAEIYTSGFRAA